MAIRYVVKIHLSGLFQYLEKDLTLTPDIMKARLFKKRADAEAEIKRQNLTAVIEELS